MKAIWLMGVALAAAPVMAQDSAPVAPPVVAKVPLIGDSLPPNTEVLLTMNSELNSKKAKVGDKFDLTVARDVLLGNAIVIPRGTLAKGEVTFRTGKGAFGKSAKMEIDIRYVDLNGRKIPLSGHFRQEGAGNTGATVGAAVAVGVFSAFVTGKSAIFPQGMELKTYTTEALPVSVPAS